MKSDLKNIFSIIRIYKYSALLLLSIMLISALTETLSLGMIMPLLEVITKSDNDSPGSIKYLYPILSHFPDHYKLMIIGVLMIILILFKNVFFVFKTWISLRFVLRCRELWMCKIMEKYLYAEYPFILSQKQGVLLNNLLVEPARATKSIQLTIAFISNAILMFFLYGMMLFVNWKITLLITIVVGIIMVSIKRLTRNYSVSVGKKRLKTSQELNAIGAESISAIRQIKLFSLEGDACKRFYHKLSYLFRILLRFKVISNLPKPIAESLVVLGIVSVLLYLQYISKSPLLNIIPKIALFAIISQKLVPIVSTLFADRMSILTFLPSLKLVYGLYMSDIKQEVLDKGEVVDRLREDIIFDNVCFAYSNTTPFFENLSLTIPKGKITAIVGPSGAGKSTIVDLLVGFLEKQGGRIMVNGIDIKEINLQSWRSLIGYISQDIFLFNATVKENILVGKPDASDEEVVETARMAYADEFIRKLPQGYDTILGDRGLKLSGGQRQRITISRAIIRNPELLIFDEATSALDSESERLIQESINNLTGQKTIIIISHRFSTVEKADKIIVLDKGKIAAADVHDELVKVNGDYSRLAKGF